jgi:pteridine reductase
MSHRSIHNVLTGQVALVTGGALRLGRAIVQGLVADGARVVIHYSTSSEAAEGLAAQIRAGGGRADTVQADLAVTEEVGGLVDRAVALAGGLDLVVNSASIFPAGGLADLDLGALTENLRVNAWAPLVLARDLARLGRSAQVVNLLDTRIAAPTSSDHLAYYLSKRALADITRSLAVELAPKLRVNGVAPGAVLAPGNAPAGYLESLASGLPLERVGGVGDVVRAVRFLVHSPFVTGQVIFVDGGQHLQGSHYG